MQYTRMLDLIEAAKRAGRDDTGWVNEQLAEAFETWVASQHVAEMSEEEEDRLRLAFEEGYGICLRGLK